MRKKTLAAFLCVDALFLGAVAYAYVEGAEPKTVGLIVGMSVILNLLYFSRHTTIRFRATQKPLSIVPPDDSSVEESVKLDDQTEVNPGFTVLRVLIGSLCVILLVMVISGLIEAWNGSLTRDEVVRLLQRVLVAIYLIVWVVRVTKTKRAA
jgi:hypothetical protein